jgi:hypothetical protein
MKATCIFSSAAVCPPTLTATACFEPDGNGSGNELGCAWWWRSGPDRAFFAWRAAPRKGRQLQRAQRLIGSMRDRVKLKRPDRRSRHRASAQIGHASKLQALANFSQSLATGGEEPAE